MTKGSIALAIGSTLAGLLLTSQAYALMFDFSGTIACLSGSSPPANCSDPLGLVGDAFTGSLAVDTSVPDSTGGDNKIGTYPNAVDSLALSFSPFIVTATGGSVTIWDDRCATGTCPPNPYQDRYEVPSFSGLGDNSIEYNFGVSFLLLQEPNATLPITLVTGDTLDQTPVVVASVNQRFFQVNYFPSSSLSCTAAGENCTQLRFTVNSWTEAEVPEPASLALLGLGLAGLGFSRRRIS